MLEVLIPYSIHKEVNLKLETYKLNTKLVFDAITEESVLHIIDSLKLKTSTGVDGISNKLLKFVKCGIAKSLTIIINQMLSVGIFPDLLKILKLYLYIRKTIP